MNYLFNAVLCILLLTGVCHAGETRAIQDSQDRTNYSLGFQIGKDLTQQGLQISSEAFLQGVKDALAGLEPQMSQQQINSILHDLKRNILDQELVERRQTRLQNKEQYRGEGREFMAQNATREGVVTLPSGLQYQIIKDGTGSTPGPHDTVKVHYRATLLDGHEFDSTYRNGQPAEFRVDGVIAGLTEALQLMKEGDHWKIFVPADLAYGERGPLADRTVSFDIELISVVSME